MAATRSLLKCGDAMSVIAEPLPPIPKPPSFVGPQVVFPGADYSDDERLFLVAMERYKRERRRPYPTWREVLQVVRSLGYRKVGS
jgi:hypothetical protein